MPKVWRVRYRSAGKPQKQTVGHFPAVGLARARLERERAKTALTEGRSPAKEKQEAKREAADLNLADNRVEALARFWLTEVAAPHPAIRGKPRSTAVIGSASPSRS